MTIKHAATINWDENKRRGTGPRQETFLLIRPMDTKKKTEVGSWVRSSRRCMGPTITWNWIASWATCLLGERRGSTKITVQLNRPGGTQTRELIPSFNIFLDRTMVLVFKDSNQSFRKVHPIFHKRMRIVETGQTHGEMRCYLTHCRDPAGRNAI